MADLIGKAVRITAKGFDIERKKLFRGTTWLALLTRDGRDNVFHRLRLYTAGFIPRSNNFKTGFYIEIATLDDLKLDILKLTHFALEGQCYAVSDGDIYPPSGDRFTWMIYGSFVKDTYALEP